MINYLKFDWFDLIIVDFLGGYQWMMTEFSVSAIDILQLTAALNKHGIFPLYAYTHTYIYINIHTYVLARSVFLPSITHWRGSRYTHKWMREFILQQSGQWTQIGSITFHLDISKDEIPSTNKQKKKKKSEIRLKMIE